MITPPHRKDGGCQLKARSKILFACYLKIGPLKRNDSENFRVGWGLAMTRPDKNIKSARQFFLGRTTMGRGILLWLLGVPIPIIILLALVWR
jgi:hypothetical protein